VRRRWFSADGDFFNAETLRRGGAEKEEGGRKKEAGTGEGTGDEAGYGEGGRRKEKGGWRDGRWVVWRAGVCSRFPKRRQAAALQKAALTFDR